MIFGRYQSGFPRPSAVSDNTKNAQSLMAPLQRRENCILNYIKNAKNTKLINKETRKDMKSLQKLLQPSIDGNRNQVIVVKLLSEGVKVVNVVTQVQ